MKKIRITFHRNGERTVEAFGYQSPECKQATKYLEDALGVAGHERKKAEWFVENSESLRKLSKIGVDGSKICG